MNQTILITGSNSGIGKITAEYFAKKNWQVIATMRNIKKAGNLKEHPNISIYQLDVTDTQSIENAKDAILNDFGKIDVVVNNAGFGCYGAFEPTTESEIDRQIAVNIKGVMMVTKIFLAHFRKNQSGLFINISSIAGLVSYPLASMYVCSKWAVEGFTEAISYELRALNIRVKLVEPGGFKTNFQLEGISWSHDESMPEYIEPTQKTIESRIQRQSNLPDPIAVAKKIFEAANDDSDRLRYLVGDDAESYFAKRKEIGAEEYVRMIYQNNKK
ncbi:MAG: SDR family oxidoreductase [Saprospiraceae bacterium]